VFPVLSPDGKLFFSSNGWPGLGGLDLFLSAGDGSDPFNLLGGFNTESDDFGIVFKDGNIGYLVSNRSGGRGKDDIYSFKADFGAIMAANSIPVRLTLSDIASTGSQILGKVILTEDGVSREVIIDASNPVIVCTQGVSEIILSVPGYKKVVLSGKRSLDPDVKRIILEPEPKEVELAQQEIKNSAGASKSENKMVTYFDYNKHSIRSDAAEILAKVTYALMEELPEAEIILTGHTDSRGSLENNLKLSQRRAEAVKSWLINKGIDVRRIKLKYMGETELLIRCSNLNDLKSSFDACLTEKEHQANRRVEIEILVR